MCALAHYLETAGIATVAISLVRLHSEIIKPPRALFVPFELGRPLGAPNDKEGQRNVISAALSLLAHVGPAAILSDYVALATLLTPANWQPPFELPGVGAPVDGRALLHEFAAILPNYDQARIARGRTTFGNSALSPVAVVSSLCRLLDGTPDGDKRLPSKAVRFLADDLKSLYFEAASLNGASLPSRALGDWFWRRTVAGQALLKLRQDFSNSDDRGRRLISSFIVPGEWLDRLGL